MAFYITLSSALFLSGKLSILLLHSLTRSMYEQLHEIESSSFWSDYYECKHTNPKYPRPRHRNNPHKNVWSSLVYSTSFVLGCTVLVLEFFLLAFQMRCYLDIALAFICTGIILSGYSFSSLLDEHDMWLGIVQPLPPIFSLPCAGFINPIYPPFSPCIPNCGPSFNPSCFPERGMPWLGPQNWGNVQPLPAQNVYFGMMQEQMCPPLLQQTLINQQNNPSRTLSRPRILPCEDEVMTLPESPYQRQRGGTCTLL